MEKVILDWKTAEEFVTDAFAAAYAIAGLVGDGELSSEYIIPRAFDERVSRAVARAVYDAAHKTGVARA